MNGTVYPSIPGISFVEAVKTAFVFSPEATPTRRYLDFYGRSSRSEFWWATLAAFLFFSVLGVVLGEVFSSFFSSFISGIVSLYFVIPFASVTVRRLREAGFHWAFAILLLFPPLSIITFVLCALPPKVTSPTV